MEEGLVMPKLTGPGFFSEEQLIPLLPPEQHTGTFSATLQGRTVKA